MIPHRIIRIIMIIRGKNKDKTRKKKMQEILSYSRSLVL